MDDHWLDDDFDVMIIDLRSAFNLVSRQAVLNAVNLHFPELLSWSTWCYGQYPILWHALGSVTSESAVPWALCFSVWFCIR